MCAIFGCYGKEDVVHDIYSGLVALQHRGQDAAGIVTFDGAFKMKKGLGLVNNVFNKKHFKRLTGKMGLGHLRYTTQGSNLSTNAQPFAANYPFGLAMVHNGNVTNFKKLRKSLFKHEHILPETTNDLELILYTLASALQKKDLSKVSVDEIFDAVEETQGKVRGAYSTITCIANHGMLAFTDPNGIRPLVLGKRQTRKGPVYGFASESTCFDFLQYEVIKDLSAGEMVFIDKNMKVHTRQGLKKKEAFCIFEHIYFAREDSVIKNRLVAAERVYQGRMLARKVNEAGLKPDIVIDVPSSGYFAASGLAEELGIPYRRGFVKNENVGRSFIASEQSERERIVRHKLNPIRQVIEGKKLAVVDDSIVRGTTSKRIVQLLRDNGAKEIYFISAAPPIENPCIYGIDMAASTELIAANNSVDWIAKFIGADALIYQDLEDIQEHYNDFPICMACFNGEYPVEGSMKALKDMEADRKKSRKQKQS